MDQLKQVLARVKKFHFWILCVLAVVLGVVGYVMGSSALKGEYSKASGQVKTSFSDVGQASAEPLRNEKSNAEIATRIQTLQQNVKQAWQAAYDGQKAILTWPEWLGESLRQDLAKLGPADDIPQAVRHQYQFAVQQGAFVRLLKIVGALDPEAARLETENKSGTPRPMPLPTAANYRILWTDSKKIKDELAKTEPLDSSQVRRMQESLWVWTNLLEIVDQVNRKRVGEKLVPTARWDEARIRRIDALEIGEAAVTKYTELSDKENRLEVSKKYVPPTVVPDPAAQTAPPPSPTGTEQTAEVADGRYIDATGKPMPAAMAAKVEYRRIPVYLHVTILQTALPDLLVACANARLPVEIRQLEVGEAKPSTGGSDAASKTATESEYWTVKVHGVLSLFNKPDDARLDGSDPNAAAAATTAPAAAPPSKSEFE